MIGFVWLAVFVGCDFDGGVGFCFVGFRGLDVLGFCGWGLL